MFAQHLGSILDPVSGQVGKIGVGSPCEAPGQTNQLTRSHARTKRVFSRLGDFALDLHGRRIELSKITMNDQPIARPQQNVIGSVTLESAVQIDASNRNLSIFT